MSRRYTRRRLADLHQGLSTILTQAEIKNPSADRQPSRGCLQKMKRLESLVRRSFATLVNLDLLPSIYGKV
jgi:hypothetical protein